MNLKLQTDRKNNITSLSQQNWNNCVQAIKDTGSSRFKMRVCVCLSSTKNYHKSYAVVKYDMAQIRNRASFVGCNIYNATLVKITLTQ